VNYHFLIENTVNNSFGFVKNQPFLSASDVSTFFKSSDVLLSLYKFFQESNQHGKTHELVKIWKILLDSLITDINCFEAINDRIPGRNLVFNFDITKV
jgi:hypothetical protein